MNFNYNIISLFVMLSLCSCANQEYWTTYEIIADFSAERELHLDSTAIVELEADSNSILSDIYSVKRIGNCYWVHSDKSLRIFDDKGSFLKTVGKFGKAKTEYLAVSNVFVDDTVVCLYDNTSRKLLTYDSHGDLLSYDYFGKEKGPEEQPTHVYKYGDGYVSTNTFGGDHRQVRALSYFGGNKEYVESVDGLFLKSGTYWAGDLFVCGDSLLYNQPMSDSLYVVKGHEVQRCYHFDFGEFALSNYIEDAGVEDKLKRLSELRQEGIDVASYIRYCQIYDGCIYFVCLAPKGYTSFCRFDAVSSQLEMFKLFLPDKNYVLLPFLEICGDEAIVCAVDANDMTKNPCLVKFKMELLTLVVCRF